MIKFVPRDKILASLHKELINQITYIEDQEDERHESKEILCARNYNCGDSIQEFFAEVIRLDNLYKKKRKSHRGRRGRRLFEEIVYNSPKDAHLTDQERNMIEGMVLDLLGRNTAYRTAWHIDHESGQSDLHILLAARTQTHPPTSSLWSRFDSENHIFVRFDECDQAIVVDP